MGAPVSVGPGEPTRGEATQSSAPRRRLREPTQREKRVHPRYSHDEFALLATAAHLSRMSVGGYVAETSLAGARSDDPTAAVADYRAMVKALMAANRQLGLIGNNLNQLTWHLHKDGAWPAPDIVARLLDRIEASVEDVDTAVAQGISGR
ncbi:plasmid mobilization relaxosome protein MobC [Streptomyces sp. AM 4-1-1]|nr:plasmid mobilization relaxosome protein MobC [Streptomyces sp. AM 4-1-1]WEH37551.1 plasmid mobilization relaxosome protein MobC [Streptomyces sp. AM 4-1-1]